jgi:hypothetical protein
MTSDNSQENSDPPAEGRQSNEQADGTEQQVTPGVTELKLPIADQKCRKSCKAQKHWLDYATFVVQSLGLIGLAVYAFLTYGIYCANKKAAHDSLVKGTRPWIGVDGDKIGVSNPPLVSFKRVAPKTVDFKVTIKYGLKNSGNSVARRVTRIFDFIPSTDEEVPNNWREMGCKLADQVSNSENVPADAIFPQAALPFTDNVEAAPSFTPMIYKRFWLTGCIAYKDMNGTTIHHTKLLFRSGNNSGKKIAVGMENTPKVEFMRVDSYSLWDTDAD